MLQQLYRIHALSTLRKYVLDMRVNFEVTTQNAKQLTAILLFDLQVEDENVVDVMLVTARRRQGAP